MIKLLDFTWTDTASHPGGHYWDYNAGALSLS